MRIPEVGDVFIRKSTGLLCIAVSIWTGLSGCEEVTVLTTNYGKTKHPLRWFNNDFEYLGKSKIDITKLWEV